MYKEDFENIQQKQRPFAKLVFQKNKNKKKNTTSRCVLSMHKLCKHDHVIYGAAKEDTSRKTNWPTCQQT